MHAVRPCARRLACSVALLLLVTLVAACANGRDSSGPAAVGAPGEGRTRIDEGEPEPGGKAVVGIPGETDGWHPSQNNWATEGHLVGSTMFETLTTFDESGDVVPFLAESVEPNDDDTVWTVKLRTGVTFHDGTPMNAEAVVENLDLATTEGLPALALESLFSSFVAVDDLTVQINLNRPHALVDTILSGAVGYIAAPSMLIDPDASEHPVGTGPFVFDDWVRDGHLRVVRNDEYWRADDRGDALPYLDEIEFDVIVDDTARQQALESGELDLMLTTQASDIASARDNPELVSIEDNLAEETFVMLNMAKPPFDNPNAREALAYGTDVAAVIDITQAGVPQVATSPFADGTPWEVDEPGYIAYDPERARAAAEAYEEETGEALEFDFAGLPVNSVVEVQQLLAAQWEQIGARANIDTLEQTSYILQTVQGDYEAAWFRNYSFRDPLTLAVFFHSRYIREPGQISTNFSRVDNAEIDRLLDGANQTRDPTDRQEIYSDIARELNTELNHVWLFHTPFALIGDPALHGLNPVRQSGFANLDPKPWINGLWWAPEDGA